MLENNMRVAQVFGVAAIRANPFLASAGAKRYHGRRVDPSPDEGILPGPAPAEPKASEKPKPATPTQVTPATAVTAKPAKPVETTTKPRTRSSARPEQEAGSETPRKPAAASGDSKRSTKKTGSGAASPKRSRSPSAPPALPDRTTTPEDTSGK